MKTTFCFTLIFLTFTTLAFVPNSFAQANEPFNMVRLIYFLPSDRTPEPNINAKMDKLIKNMQIFFADEMERHGFGRKTFVFETDSDGNAVVHRVNGDFDDAYYRSNTFVKVSEEVSQQFDTTKNIYLIVVDVSTRHIGTACGVANTMTNVTGDWGGIALIPADGYCSGPDFEGMVPHHELGHCFGLSHDFRNNAYLMSFGQKTELSLCNAEWLDTHRYFNTRQTPPDRGETTIQMLPPVASPPYGIRLQFTVSDTDGLQIAHLLTIATSGSEGAGQLKLLGCKNLTGENQTVEFVNIELSTQSESVRLHVIDDVGNLTTEHFPINVSGVLPPKVVTIPDVNLATVVREALGLAPNSTITQLDMLGLTELTGFTNRQITNLTGLEHARNLKYLELYYNQISDIAILAQLPNLVRVDLLGNQISDFSALKDLPNLLRIALGNNPIDDISSIAEFTQLTDLWLGALHTPIQDLTPFAGLTNLINLQLFSNRISDVSPLAGLTQLWYLRLSGNQLSDISPLAGLTNLRELGLRNNQISDISPLAGLIQLGSLELSDNQLSDISPLVELTNLRELYLAGNPIEDFSPLRTLLANNPNLKIDIDIPDPSPLAFSPSTIADQTFTVGEAVNLTLPVATGGTPPYAYTLAPLPGGFSFDATERVLSGRPTTAGTTTATYTATDAASVSASLTFTIEVTEGVILDVNGDGLVNVLDLAIVALFYGTQVPADISLPADVNADGVVDILDLTAVAQGIDAAGENQLSVEEVAQAVLMAAEQAAELEAAAGAPRRIGSPRTAAFLSVRLAAKNVAAALATARTDVRFQKGFALLEELLALLTEILAIPETTALLPNYPNPFNPETWIPYHLAQDAHVTLTIYDMRGVAVRQLMLGYQPAGIYRSKHRAAYWDGRNEEGEPVASGLYFYTLRTSDFAVTRKLIIRK